MPMISLVATVLNEGDSIHRLFDSIQRQTRPPDEIVIVDGGSQDQTLAIMRAYAESLPLRLLVEEGCNISQGRNRAIQAAKGDIVAVTDAGVQLQANWLEAITAPLLKEPGLHAVAGFFRADPHSAFEAALGAASLPLADEIEPASFLPSSRSIAFRKEAFLRAGQYPEWLDYCEDLVFDIRLRAIAGPFHFAPEALVAFRPRSSLRAFCRQYYLYARGDGKADLWFKRHLIRYFVYLILLPALLLLGALAHPLAWAILALGGVAYLQRPYRRLPALMRRYAGRSSRVWLACLALIPPIRLAGDLAKMLGYPVGRLWRARHRPPNWRATGGGQADAGLEGERR